IRLAAMDISFGSLHILLRLQRVAATTRMLSAAAVLLYLIGGAAADELGDCNDPKYPVDAAIAACSHLIDHGGLKGHDLAVAYRGRGAAHFRKDETDAALADFERAIALDPAYALAYR